MTNSRIEAIERATNRSWSEWLAYLESIHADRLDNHAIATHLLTELEGVVDNLGWSARSSGL